MTHKEILKLGWILKYENPKGIKNCNHYSGYVDDRGDSIELMYRFDNSWAVIYYTSETPAKYAGKIKTVTFFKDLIDSMQLKRPAISKFGTGVFEHVTDPIIPYNRPGLMSQLKNSEPVDINMSMDAIVELVSSYWYDKVSTDRKTMLASACKTNGLVQRTGDELNLCNDPECGGCAFIKETIKEYGE